jgi:hypothetical protein
MRRRIRKEIYDLQHQDEGNLYDVNPGDIKLPTTYEIRRAMRGAPDPRTTHVTVTSHNRIIVNGTHDPQEVADRVYDTIERHTTQGVAAAGRSAGVR